MAGAGVQLERLQVKSTRTCVSTRGLGPGLETFGARGGGPGTEIASHGLGLVTMETTPNQGTFYQRGHKPLSE